MRFDVPQVRRHQIDDVWVCNPFTAVVSHGGSIAKNGDGVNSKTRLENRNSDAPKMLRLLVSGNQVQRLGAAAECSRALQGLLQVLRQWIRIEAAPCVLISSEARPGGSGLPASRINSLREKLIDITMRLASVAVLQPNRPQRAL